MNELQQQASDPNYSVWVSASAGTGKTKILTDRVLRLLINNVPFEKILCLTFTNAAALEMQSRIRSKLEYFALIDTSKLVAELKSLLSKEPSNDKIQSAKTLYQKLLNSTYGISIYTIHAFCQKLLKLFAFEAGVSPEFEILDDITAQEILQKIKNQIYLSPEHSQLINFFLTNFHEVTINDIFNEIIQQKIKFRKLFSKKIDYLEETETTYTTHYHQELYDKIRSLFTKYSIDITDDQEILQFFLTKDFSKRKNILPKPLATKHPELLPELEYFQDKIFRLDQQHKINEIKNYSRSLYQLAKIFLDEYDTYKAKHSLLDYDDLIYYTQILLSNQDTKDWILYKLDGWISHLLVDEAQDTSPEQWQIITAIIEEFYKSAKHNNTVFIVGDEKQSIFSFQGADLDSFDTINKNLQQNFSKANKNFRNITLEWSYRSTEEVINIVYIILYQIKNTTPQLFTSENPKILPFRNTHNGRVEIWPLVKNEKEDKLFWPTPEDYNNVETSIVNSVGFDARSDGAKPINNMKATSDDASKPQSTNYKTLLADKIAKFIKQQIANKKILHATNSPVKESDFMILVRKRDELVLEIIATLKKHDLQVEDIDKVTLDQNLSVMDLMSIAKFVLLPQDNLNLASLLKSPIIGMSEEELQNLAIARGKNSLWEYLKTVDEYGAIYEKLCYFLQIYKTSNCGSFFALIVDCFDIRKILVASNGPNSNDLINELIYLSSNYSNNVDSLLQNFVYWFENNNIEIKRNLESSNKIKIMTAHASKGLQAPIVILCDTTSTPVNSNKFVWTEDGEMFSAIKSTNSPEFFRKLKEQQQEKELQEYIRLLYVAMTRAEDHLVVCGYQSNNSLPKNCWYELVSKAMSIHGLLDKNNIIIYETNNKEKITTSSQTNEIISEPISLSTSSHYKNFSFDRVLFNKIIKSTKKNYSVKSPLIANDHLQYGRIFHKILEDSAKVNDFSTLSKHPYIQTLPINLQEKIYKNIDKLLNNHEFTKLSSGQLKTEVTVGINLNDEPKIGRIDLLAIEEEKITIIDYKSDAHPPKTPDLVNESYIDQLNFYRHMIQKLYPDSEVICKILWLENGSFMSI
ncbi:MAG: UvrD-helicase domain-containing protein [Candidatus Rickettsia vulgarisii]